MSIAILAFLPEQQCLQKERDTMRPPLSSRRQSTHYVRRSTAVAKCLQHLCDCFEFISPCVEVRPFSSAACLQDLSPFLMFLPGCLLCHTLCGCSWREAVWPPLGMNLQFNACNLAGDWRGRFADPEAIGAPALGCPPHRHLPGGSSPADRPGPLGSQDRRPRGALQGAIARD